MKYVLAAMLATLAACGGTKNDRPPATAREPVSTTTTTSAALTSVSDSEAVKVDTTAAPIVGVKESDRGVASSIRAHLARDKSLANVPWRRVTMEVEDQHVTLRGELPTIADSTEVERAVREVKGVRAVTNEIRATGAWQWQ